MEKHEKVKQALNQCSLERCAYCPYKRDGCVDALLDDALEYINELETRAQRWIRVEDDLPEKDTEVMVYDKGGLFGLAYYDSAGTWHSYATCYRITHWMPLPKAPEE